MNMDHVISMEEILDPFWDLPPPDKSLVTGNDIIDGVVTNGDGGCGNTVDQSSSEWSFERLLEEDLLADLLMHQQWRTLAAAAQPFMLNQWWRWTMQPWRLWRLAD